MARMTISLTVILLEATGNMQYVLPLMMTLMAARFTGEQCTSCRLNAAIPMQWLMSISRFSFVVAIVGNVFNEGLYDIHIHLKHIPFLEPEVPTIAERHEIVAGQVMSTEVKCLRPVERVGIVYDLLKNVQHGNFPIVDTGELSLLGRTSVLFLSFFCAHNISTLVYCNSVIRDALRNGFSIHALHSSSTSCLWAAPRCEQRTLSSQ